MLSQYDLIHKTNWKTLIILDACRYDYFERYNFLKGRLFKCKSSAPHTYIWLEKTFPKFYDLTYFSAHPYIGHKINPRQSYNAPLHFKEVISIWNLAWDDKLGTVHPKNVCKVVKMIPYDRAIVHFIQPHGPWIGETKLTTEWTLRDHSKYGIMGDGVIISKRPDPDLLKKAYRDNLLLVLKVLKEYYYCFRQPVIITADHGEMLGEGGYYLHKVGYPKWTDEILYTVPWFIWKEKFITSPYYI